MRFGTVAIGFWGVHYFQTNPFDWSPCFTCSPRKCASVALGFSIHSVVGVMQEASLDFENLLCNIARRYWYSLLAVWWNGDAIRSRFFQHHGCILPPKIKTARISGLGLGFFICGSVGLILFGCYHAHGMGLLSFCFSPANVEVRLWWSRRCHRESQWLILRNEACQEW